MIAAAPEGSPPRRISNKQFKKTLPAVPRRGPEAGFHPIHYDFHGSGVNPIGSCLFLQSPLFNNYNARGFWQIFLLTPGDPCTSIICIQVRYHNKVMTPYAGRSFHFSLFDDFFKCLNLNPDGYTPFFLTPTNDKNPNIDSGYQ
jgi:hypothetical protein